MISVTISTYLLVCVIASMIAWVLITLMVVLLMFGDDRAFIAGPAIASVAVGLFWIVKLKIVAISCLGVWS